MSQSQWQEDHSVSVFSSGGHLYIDGSWQMSKFLQKGDQEIERYKNHYEYIAYYVLTIILEIYPLWA